MLIALCTIMPLVLSVCREEIYFDVSFVFARMY